MLLPWPLLLGTCCFMLLLPPDLAGQGQHKIKRNTRWLAWLLMEIEIETETEIALLLLLLLTTLFNCTYDKPIVTANAKTVRFAGQK
jgi:hypothetical protein